MNVQSAPLQRQQLLIIGASARAAAMSAVRAGFEPIAADLFGDVDLRRICHTTTVADYPHGFADVVRSTEASAWLYTGALENYPELIEAIEKGTPLLGNSAAVLRRVRDPLPLYSALRSDNLDVPGVSVDARDLPLDGTWLVKPLRSAGGFGVLEYYAPRATPAYYQRRIDGLPCSAVFVSANGESALLGVTEQLIGCSWAGADGFRYCGSIGPRELSREEQETWQQIGNCLAKQFGLIGIWGVDAIVEGGRVWPVEVNPRYTASVEIIERTTGIHSLALHVAACTKSTLPTEAAIPTRLIAGKAIVFSPADIYVDGPLAQWLSKTDAAQQQLAWPHLADIPERGTLIRKGWPIATVFAEAPTRDDCEAELRRRAAELLSLVSDQAIKSVTTLP